MGLGRRLVDIWRGAAEEAGGTQRLNELLARLSLFFSGGWVLALVFFDWVRSPFFASPILSGVVLVGFALGILDIAAAVQQWRPARRFAILVPVSIGYLVLSHYILFTSLVPFYGTDGMAFAHYSAILLLEGQNPYTSDHLAALDLFRIPGFYVTPTETGGLVNRQTYPALSFLLYVPLVALGVQDMRVVSLFAHLAAIILVYRIAPLPLKPFGPLSLGLADQLDFTPGAVQDILWVPILLLGMAFDERPRISGSFFGIACALKSVPWLIAPFLVIRLLRLDPERPLPRSLVNFAGFAGLWFLVFNGPFIVWDAAAWFSGVVDPFVAPNVPLGPGLSILSQAAWISLPRTFFTIAVLSVAGCLLAIEYTDFAHARYLTWWFPAIAMFFAYRSLQNYFIYWYPFVFVSLAIWYRSELRSVRDGNP